MSAPWDYIAKVICLGDSGTGKSSLTVRLCEGRFNKTDVTIGVELDSRVGALLVYDITRKDTLSHVQRWLSDLRNLGEPHISIVLVGNKCDLADRRQVSTEEAAAWAKENGINFHVETSAKTGESVERAFVEVAQEIYRNIRDGVYDPRGKNTGLKVKLGTDSRRTVHRQADSQCCS
ncbi:hypothetical protein TWF703_003238 [Orbilia oligospora]|uniref:Uncharacterized protein n=1 Tax=Orbilia oligospora TaxID=2813651 RepID=A0A7C8NNR9_ORBOL|nr:hypothetical protein TWF703_003238 [Orbilia oligospora]